MSPTTSPFAELSISLPPRLPCGHEEDPISPCDCAPRLARWLNRDERQEENEMVVARLLPSYERSMFFGQERAGKSTMMMATGVCASSGTKFLGQYEVPKQRRVLYVSGEDRTALLERRALDILCVHWPSAKRASCRFALDDMQRYGLLTLVGKDHRLPGSRRPLLLTDEEAVNALVGLITDLGANVVYLDSLMRLTAGHLGKPDPDIVEVPIMKLEATGAMVVMANHEKAGAHRAWGKARSGAGGLNIATAVRAAVGVTPRPKKEIEHQRRQLSDGWVETAFRCRLAFDGTEAPAGAICDVETVYKMPPDQDGTKSEMVSMTAYPVEGGAAGAGADLQKAALEALRDPTLLTDRKGDVFGIKTGRLAKHLGVSDPTTRRVMAGLASARRVGGAHDPGAIWALA
jgi:hypothetical protein